MAAPNATADRQPRDSRPTSSAKPFPEPSASSPASVGWATGALLLTGALAVAAKVAGVVLVPGVRGVAPQRTVELFELASSTLAYTLAALVVALVCGGAFELARTPRIGTGPRGTAVAVSGLVVALASPAVVQRLPTVGLLALALITSVVVLIGGAVALRAPHTRALGAVLGILAICALLRAFAWECAAIAGERASLALYQIGRTLSTAAVALHAIAVLLAAAWLGTRSRFRGRLLANLAIVLACIVTYVAARSTEGPPSTFEAVLRGGLLDVAAVPAPYALSPIAAFLLPVSVLLAITALAQRVQHAAVAGPLALVLVSHGAFDVPLQALTAIAAAQWAMLAMADPRTMWTSLSRARKDTEDER
jgi:hypothetical protein